MRNRMLVLSIALLLVLLSAVASHASAPQVGVRIEGPDVGWVDEELTYWGDWACHFDEETLQELYDGRATVGVECEWEIDPAAMVGGNGTTEIIIKYAWEDGGSFHTIKLTVTATVTYADGTSDQATGSHSMSVKVRRPMLGLPEVEHQPICAGHQWDYTHIVEIRVRVDDGFGDPAEGWLVGMEINILWPDYRWVQERAVLHGSQEVTDESGWFRRILQSSDQECEVYIDVVLVRYRDKPGQRQHCTVDVAPPSSEPDAAEPAVIAVGHSTGLQETLTHDITTPYQTTQPVPGHTIAWEIVSVYDEDGDLVTSPTAEDYGSVTASSVTDEDGIAEATYSAGAEAGYITIQATDMTCYNADGEHPALDTYSVIVTHIDHLEVEDAYQIGDTDAWAAGVTDGEEFVTITAVMKPSISPEQAEGIVNWTGGEAVSSNPLQRVVSKQTTGTTTVTASTGWLDSHSVTINICEITSISLVSGAVSIDDDNAVTGADPAATEAVIVQANLSPSISPVPTQLLLWMGGAGVADHPEQRQVPRTLPQKAELRCECGDSYDMYAVWVIAVDIGIAGVSEADEDTTPAECYVNSDDDDGDSTQDLNDTPVPDENDLIAVTLMVTPEGVPAGTVTVTETARLDLWEDQEKGTEWDGSVDLASEELPKTLWVEGKSISDDPGDQSVTMEYDWSTVHMEDEVLVTVLPRDGDSEAYLKLFRSYNSGTHVLSDELTGTVGGTCKPVLYIEIGPGEHIKTGTSSVTVRITDEYADYFEGTDVDTDIVVSLTTTENWDIQTSPTTWAAASVAPASADNKNGSVPIVYRFVGMNWNTMTQPLGNNGRHSVATTSQIEFEEWVVGDGWTNEYECGPVAKSVTTENVCVNQNSIGTSNGTCDYFKWDPLSEDLDNPHITFTIDDADPHDYYCIIRFRETIGEGTWDWDSGWSSMRYKPTTPSNRSIDIDLTVPDYQGKCLNENDHEWGTYTFDVQVLEYATGVQPTLWTEAEALDSNFMKRCRDGYHMWVPEYLPPPNSDEPGHDAWRYITSNGVEMRGYYCLHSEDELDAGQANMLLLDPDLAERANTSGPTQHDVGHGITDEDEDGYFDGLKVGDMELGGLFRHIDWRVLLTASDQAGLHSGHWRSHTTIPMLAANKLVSNRLIEYIEGEWPSGCEWMAAVHLFSGTSKIVHDTRSEYKTPISYINGLSTPGLIEVGVNGCLFDLGGTGVMGDVGEGTAGAGNWLDLECVAVKSRWAVGWPDITAAQHSLGRSTTMSVPEWIERNCAYGFSGLGCIHDKNGWKNAYRDNDNWPNPEGSVPRTILAWVNLNSAHVLFIQLVGKSWTWDEALEFCRSRLCAEIFAGLHLAPCSLVVRDCVHLDGGGSSQFIYAVSGENPKQWANVSRKVPNFVRGSLGGQP